jgi:hypothetical protein
MSACGRFYACTDGRFPPVLRNYSVTPRPARSAKAPQRGRFGPDPIFAEHRRGPMRMVGWRCAETRTPARGRGRCAESSQRSVRIASARYLRRRRQHHRQLRNSATAARSRVCSVVGLQFESVWQTKSKEPLGSGEGEDREAASSSVAPIHRSIYD